MSAKHSSAPPASGQQRVHDSIEFPVAGVVLPIERAEELLVTLPGVLSARIVPGPTGEVSEVHVLTTTEVNPKQTVRNVESALLAQLGMRVSHKKISVATSEGPAADAFRAARTAASANGAGGLTMMQATVPQEPGRGGKRRLYFEDVEVRRSRASGTTCRVTLRDGAELYIGEAQGVETDRQRIETSARAAVTAVLMADVEGRTLTFEGVKIVEAFERQFVFVGLTTRFGRETALLTGTAEVRDGVETASVLAVLDATNRWVGV